MGRELVVHLVERVAGDAQRGEHLLAGGFSAAALLANVRFPFDSPAKHGSQDKGSRQLVPQDHRSARALPGAARHDFGLEAERRGTPLQGLAQLLFELAPSGSDSTCLLLDPDVLPQMVGGLGPQQFEAALQMALDRGQRRIQRGGNLFRR